MRTNFQGKQGVVEFQIKPSYIAKRYVVAQTAHQMCWRDSVAEDQWYGFCRPGEKYFHYFYSLSDGLEDMGLLQPDELGLPLPRSVRVSYIQQWNDMHCKKIGLTPWKLGSNCCKSQHRENFKAGHSVEVQREFISKVRWKQKTWTIWPVFSSPPPPALWWETDCIFPWETVTYRYGFCK